MSVNEKMTAIADAIRDKTGGTEKLGLDAMAAGVGEVYTAGIEQGKQAEYDILWDNLQLNGRRTHYAYAFAYTGWNDAIYNPKYPIAPTHGEGIGSMFSWNAAITDTKVPITAFGKCNGAFNQMTGLRRIPKLIFDGATNVSNMFNGCIKLEELYCEGELSLSLSLAQSNLLNDASIQSVIDVLANLTGQPAQTLTFHKDVGNKLTQAQKDAISAKNWTLVY